VVKIPAENPFRARNHPGDRINIRENTIGQLDEKRGKKTVSIIIIVIQDSR
jgi:hypothetical protein